MTKFPRTRGTAQWQPQKATAPLRGPLPARGGTYALLPAAAEREEREEHTGRRGAARSGAAEERGESLTTDVDRHAALGRLRIRVRVVLREDQLGEELDFVLARHTRIELRDAVLLVDVLDGLRHRDGAGR